MDQRAGAEEEERLEHCVGEQMEHTGHVAEAMVEFRTGNAERNHHECNLRDG